MSRRNIVLEDGLANTHWFVYIDGGLQWAVRRFATTRAHVRGVFQTHYPESHIVVL